MPLSNDDQARQRQLANLVPGAGAAGNGNLRPLKHGAYSEALLADVSAEVRELMDELGERAPVRGADGSLPAADLIAVERAARLLRRYRQVEGWLDLHGAFVERTGAVKPAARFAAELGESLGRALEVLGMDPKSRARLGLDLARTVDAATAMSEPDPARRRALMAEAGLTVDEEAGDDDRD